MSAPPFPSPRVRHPVSPSKPAQALQLLQGGYYVVAGLLTAFAVELWQPDAGRPTDLTHYWAVRAVGLAAAAVGAYLAYSGWTRGRAAPAGLGMWAALALAVVETAALALGALPNPFLIDVAVEAVLLVSWVVVMFRQVDKQVARTEAASPAVG